MEEKGKKEKYLYYSSEPEIDASNIQNDCFYENSQNYQREISNEKEKELSKIINNLEKKTNQTNINSENMDVILKIDDQKSQEISRVMSFNNNLDRLFGKKKFPHINEVSKDATGSVISAEIYEKNTSPNKNSEGNNSRSSNLYNIDILVDDQLKSELEKNNNISSSDLPGFNNKNNSNIIVIIIVRILFFL